jgi:CheY-like chemotaxis protein
VEGELKGVPIVLVVEDEEPLQEIVHDALKEGGFDLTTVASGQDAVAMIESGVVKYSALVTDVNLKGPMKGWEIARLVRQIDPAFPIVYMTGAAADDWASEGVPNSILLKSRLLQRNWLRQCPNCSTRARRPPGNRHFCYWALFGPDAPGRRCPLIGEEQKFAARCQSDAIDP